MAEIELTKEQWKKIQKGMKQKEEIFHSKCHGPVLYEADPSPLFQKLVLHVKQEIKNDPEKLKKYKDILRKELNNGKTETL